MENTGEITRKGGNNAKDRDVRKRFLYAYEKTYGNVQKSCRYAGISRQTYYRWMKGNSSIHRRFQRRIEISDPDERRLDDAEMVLCEAVQAGKWWAIKFVLSRKGRDRRW